MTGFAQVRHLAVGYDEALARLPDALKAEGFGVVTEVDLAATLKTKLGVDIGRYKIVGACNPALAHRALAAEPAIGLMLPCNLVVTEAADGTATVMAIDPTHTIAAAGVPALAEVATTVRDKLAAALARL